MFPNNLVAVGHFAGVDFADVDSDAVVVVVSAGDDRDYNADDCDCDDCDCDDCKH